MAQLAVATTPLGWLKVGLFGASVLGSFLLNGSREENKTKLQDLKVSTSTYGKGIQLVWGTDRVTGNMFWATDFVERKRRVSKGMMK